MPWSPESTAQREEFERQVRLLTDNDAGVRNHALETLKTMGPGALSALPAHIDVLNKQFLFTKEKCLRALALVGPVAVDAMWSMMPADQAKKTGEKAFRAEAMAGIERVRKELK